LLKILPVNNKLSIPMCSDWIISQVCTKVRRLAGCERELSYRIRASPVKAHKQLLLYFFGGVKNITPAELSDRFVFCMSSQISPQPPNAIFVLSPSGLLPHNIPMQSLCCRRPPRRRATDRRSSTTAGSAPLDHAWVDLSPHDTKASSPTCAAQRW
jgi:hypothetical protein